MTQNAHGLPGLFARAAAFARYDSVKEELWLLPEAAGRCWPGAHFTRVGQALGVGLHLSGDTRAPLVLDAPLSWTNPRNQGLILEALSGTACPQVVVAAHECQIDELVVALWERLNRIYLVEGSWEVRTSLLSEPVVEGRAD